MDKTQEHSSGVSSWIGGTVVLTGGIVLAMVCRSPLVCDEVFTRKLEKNG